ELGTTGSVSVDWAVHQVGGRVAHQVQFISGGTGFSDEHAILWNRLICHVLIDRMPARSLEESLESLKNILERSHLGAPHHAAVSQLPPAPVPAQIMPTRNRDEFFAEED